MSRSGYDDGCEYLALYRGQVESAIRGRRGQAMLRDLRHALDAMPEKQLTQNFIVSSEGVCSLGALGRYRGIDLADIDGTDNDGLAATFNVAPCLIAEVEYMNDEAYWKQTPERRWETMRKWVAENIKTPEARND